MVGLYGADGTRLPDHIRPAFNLMTSPAHIFHDVLVHAAFHPQDVFLIAVRLERVRETVGGETRRFDCILCLHAPDLHVEEDL